MLPEDALDAYGIPLHTYRGTGQLTVSSGGSLSCQFVAGQLENCDTFMLCATPDLHLDLGLSLVRPTGFLGTTNQGELVAVDRVASSTNYLPQANTQGRYLALRVGHLSITRPGDQPRELRTYLLANVGGFYADLSFSYGNSHFTVTPVENAVDTLARLQVLRGVLPTAHLAVSGRGSIESVTKEVDDLCYLLSIAYGTKVQWVALTESAPDGSWVCRHHYSRVTKRFGSLCTIDPRDSDIASFLQNSDGRLTHARTSFGLTEAAIDAYLDAKAEGDFLQVRALKLVVAVEMLKAGYVDRAGAPLSIVPPMNFETLFRELKDTIKRTLTTSTPEQRKDLYANLVGINRPPFSSQLEQFCEAIRMQLDTDDLRRFVASRNKLVHEGHFYRDTATEQERLGVQPLSDIQSEWFWLLHFVDRLFLRTIGYQGPYIDWSTPGGPIPRQLRPDA